MPCRTPEFSHKLTPNNNEELERHVNLKAVALKLEERALGEIEAKHGSNSRRFTQASRDYINHKNRLGELCMKCFHVTGEDLYDGEGKKYGYDEALLFAVAKSLNDFQPERGTFAHLVRRIAKTERLAIATKEDAFQKRLVNEQECNDKEERGPLDNITSNMDFNDVNVCESVRAEDNALEGKYIEVLALIIGFLDHREDKRRYTQKKKTYIRLFFTESVTRAVKECQTVDECVPFERHERDTLRSVELPFQDVYTAYACATIRSLWSVPLKKGYGEILPYGHPNRAKTSIWHLEADVFRGYINDAYGESVSRAAISNQRENYRALLAKLRIPSASL